MKCRATADPYISSFPRTCTFFFHPLVSLSLLYNMINIQRALSRKSKEKDLNTCTTKNKRGEKMSNNYSLNYLGQIINDIVEDVFSYSYDESLMADYEIVRLDDEATRVFIDMLTEKMASKKWKLLNRGDNWALYRHGEELLLFYVDYYDKKVVAMRLKNAERLCVSKKKKKMSK